jgi:hypothetical protein
MENQTSIPPVPTKEELQSMGYSAALAEKINRAIISLRAIPRVDERTRVGAQRNFRVLTEEERTQAVLPDGTVTLNLARGLAGLDDSS